MKNPLAFYLSLSLLCFFLQSALSFNINGVMIKDLEATDATFADEAAYWNGTAHSHSITTHLPAPLYSQCGTNYVLGGSPVLSSDGSFQRKYKNIPPHEIIYYSIHLTLMNKWNSGSSIIILFDQDSFGAGVFLMDYIDDFLSDACGDGDNDLPGIRIYGKAEHDEKSLNLRVLSTSHDSGEDRSFGIRDVVLLFRNKTDDEEESQMCAVSSVPLHLGNCTCGEGFYEFPLGSGNCEECDDLCQTCLGPLTSQCMTCADDAFFNGTHCQKCHSSCETCSGPSDTDCLTCSSSDYFILGGISGGSCSSTCDLPLVADNTLKKCHYNCPADHYLYSDGSCLPTCSFVYDNFVEFGRQFCYDYCFPGHYYVPPSSSNVLGTCVSSGCPFGYFQDNVPRYCHTCQDPFCEVCPTNNGATCQACKNGAILDTDGICKPCSSMQFIYVKATDSGHEYQMTLENSQCSLSSATVIQSLAGTPHSISNFPVFSFAVLSKTANTYMVMVTFQGSVLEAGALDVTLAHLSAGLNVPKKLVPSPTLATIGELAPAAEVMVGSLVGASFAGTLTLGATASLWSIISFQQFVGYFKYINIEFPYQMKIFFSILKSADWNFLPNPLDGITESLNRKVMKSNGEEFEEYQPPAKFMENDVTSFFIDNAGGILTLNLGLLILLVIVLQVKKMKRFRKSTILKKVKVFLKWNVIARTFLENAIPLILGVFLQLRILSFGKAYLVLCSILAVFAIIYFLIFSSFITKVLYKKNSEQLDKEPIRKMYGTLYEGISLKDQDAKYYNIIILIRGVLLVALITFCSKIPILQIVGLIPFNAGLVYFLFKVTVFEDRYLGIVNKIKEILILFGEIGILFLNFKSSSEAYYDTLGWLITLCFMTAMLIELVYMIALQIYNLRLIKKKAIDFWNVVSRWISNLKARRRHRRQRVRRVVPQNIKLELSAMPTSDVTLELSRAMKLGQPLKVSMLNSFNTTKPELPEDVSQHTLEL